MLLSVFMQFLHLHHICGINRETGVSQGRCLKAGRYAVCDGNMSSCDFFILPAQPQDPVFYSLACRLCRRLLFLILPAQPQDTVFFSFPLLSFLPCRWLQQGLVSYSFLLSFFFTLPVTPAGSCFLLVSSFFLLSFFFLATRLFHILPYIRFWPNLVKVTGTLTTTQAQTMVGSEVTMGSLGSKRSFSSKRHQVLQNT